jgi:hypothetical protein
MQLNIGEPKERTPLGISDKGSIISGCNKCGKNLMIFQLTKTNEELVKERKEPITTTVAIFCETCKHINSIFTIKGQFYPGAFNDKIKFEVDENIQHGDGITPDCNIIFKVKNNV